MFNPGLIPNPLCSGQQPESWHDTSDSSTIVTGIGSRVSLHRDKSGHGRSRSQVPGATQPETGLDNINGRNAFRYTSVNHTFLQASNYLSFGDYTIFLVFAPDLIGSGIEPEPHFISVRKGSGTFSSLFSVLTQVIPAGPIGNILVRWATGITAAGTPASVISDDVPVLVTIRLVRNQAAGLIRIDGVTQASGFTYAPTEDDQPQIVWGTNFSAPSSGDFKGKEGENLIYKTAFELHQIEFLENYIKNNFLLW
jgi:hypothetical protein